MVWRKRYNLCFIHGVPTTWDADLETDSNPNRIAVNGDAHLILLDGGKLTLSKGFNVPAASSLTIYGQPVQADTKTGELKIEGVDEDNAAIGGNGGAEGGTDGDGGAVTVNGGNVTVNGGVVTANGGLTGAGIGGGY